MHTHTLHNYHAFNVFFDRRTSPRKVKVVPFQKFPPLDNSPREITKDNRDMSTNQPKEQKDAEATPRDTKQTNKFAEAKKSLKCGLCSDKFHEPKLLSCLHSFCLNCLRRYVEKGKYKSKFPCPLCSRSIDIPKSGGVKVSSNIYLFLNSHSTG